MKRDDIIMFALQKGRCFYCGKAMLLDVKKNNHLMRFRWSRDHFFPKKINSQLKGNMVLAHKVCNAKKADRLPTKSEITKFNQLMKLKKKRNKEIDKIKFKVKYFE